MGGPWLDSVRLAASKSCVPTPYHCSFPFAHAAAVHLIGETFVDAERVPQKKREGLQQALNQVVRCHVAGTVKPDLQLLTAYDHDSEQVLHGSRRPGTHQPP